MLWYEFSFRLKEYQDVVDLQNNRSVRDMMSQMQFDQQMTKEQQVTMVIFEKHRKASLLLLDTVVNSEWSCKILNQKLY